MEEEIYLYDENYDPAEDSETTRYWVLAVVLIVFVALAFAWRYTEPSPLVIEFQSPRIDMLTPVKGVPTGATGYVIYMSGATSGASTVITPAYQCTTGGLTVR